MSEFDVYLRLRARAQRRAVPAASRRHLALVEPPLVVLGYHLANEPSAVLALCYGTAPDAMRVAVAADPRDREQRHAALSGFAADLCEYLTGPDGTAPDRTASDGMASDGMASDRTGPGSIGVGGSAPGGIGAGGSAPDGTAPGGRSPGAGEQPRITTPGFVERADVERPARRGAEAGAGAEVEQVCVRAPQLMVPNHATAAWLCEIVARLLHRGPYPAPAGAHLAHLATRRVLPGSAMVLVATEALTRHWSTGQLPAEDANLHTLLAWIDPPDGDGAAAALAAEALPPAGPVADPGWDADVLRAAIASGDERRVRDAAVAALTPGWRATWRARELLAGLPAAARVSDRYELDRRAWTHHLDRIAAGARVGWRLDTLRSFAFLAELERRTAELERQQALDDPLVMARYVAAGDALAGTVVGRDLECFEPSRRGNPVRRPRLAVRPELSFDRPPGTALWLADRPGVQLRTGEMAADGTVTCVVVKGMGRSLAQADAAVPGVGERVVLAPFGPADAFPTNLPDELPWTHRVPAEPA